jgi:Uma2 family endonuclease
MDAECQTLQRLSSMGEPNPRRMSADEFFAWQSKQDRLYELVDGLPILPLKMMTGASQAHDRVVVNIIATLHTQLRGTPCRPTTDDLAVRIPAGNIRRPDVTIECGEGSPKDMAVKDPRVVIEVLSPSTMNFDRVTKLPEYQSIESLSDIVLVDTELPRIDLMSRQPDGSWARSRIDGLDASIDLPAIGARLNLVDVFEGMAFPELRGPRVI